MSLAPTVRTGEEMTKTIAWLIIIGIFLCIAGIVGYSRYLDNQEQKQMDRIEQKIDQLLKLR